MGKREKKDRIFEENVVSIIKTWSTIMGLDAWSIKIMLCDNKKSTKKLFKSGRRDVTCVAKTWSDWRYMKALIYLNVPELIDREANYLRDIMVHELCHVMVEEMRSEEKDHEERVVTLLQKALVHAYNQPIEEVSDEPVP